MFRFFQCLVLYFTLGPIRKFENMLYNNNLLNCMCHKNLHKDHKMNWHFEFRRAKTHRVSHIIQTCMCLFSIPSMYIVYCLLCLLVSLAIHTICLFTNNPLVYSVNSFALDINLFQLFESACHFNIMFSHVSHSQFIIQEHYLSSSSGTWIQLHNHLLYSMATYV